MLKSKTFEINNKNSLFGEVVPQKNDSHEQTSGNLLLNASFIAA